MKYAVGYTAINGDEPLKIEIIEAEGWKEALLKHTFCVNYPTLKQ